MDLITEGIGEAFALLAARDALVLGAAARSVTISVSAVLLAAAVGIPLASVLAEVRVPGRSLLLFLFRGGMGMPTVLIGLVGFALFSRRGPLGPFELLYTSTGVMVCEVALAVPIVVSLTHSALTALDPRLGETARTLGAGAFRRWRTLLREARPGVTLALLTAFARCFSELGIAMMVGGNIKHRTRTLSTATALETSKGELARGFAMSLILLAIALLVTCAAAVISRRAERAGR